MSLEGLFEINDHKAAFLSLLNPPPCCCRQQLCLEMLSACALLPTSAEQNHTKSVMDDAQDARAASQSRSKEFKTGIRWGRQWSEAQAERSRRQPYGRQDEKACWVLVRAELCQQLSWHPCLWESDMNISVGGGSANRRRKNSKVWDEREGIY